MYHCDNSTEDMDDLSHLFLACSVTTDDCEDIEEDEDDKTWWIHVVRFDGEAPLRAPCHRSSPDAGRTAGQG